MSKKPEFDLVMLTIGHRQYAVPKDGAMAIFSLFTGQDVYEVNNTWSGDTGTMYLAKLMTPDQNPTIGALGPVQFHQMLENQRMKEEEEAAKKKARENA
jgi:hypothetical protein